MFAVRQCDMLSREAGEATPHLSQGKMLTTNE